MGGAKRAVKATTTENSSGKKAKVASEAAAFKITVTVDPMFLECCVCFSALVPPIFQCTSGHITCSECCTDLDYSCSVCARPEKATRCRAMEHVLSSLTVPCTFQEHGCTEMIPYAEKLTHEESCLHAPCYCPLTDCHRPYAGRSLRDHINLVHPAIEYTGVTAASLTPLRMHDSEPARLVHLHRGGGRGTFLVVVDRSVPSGRTLSVIHLINEPSEEEDFKYKILVNARTGMLSLSGETESVRRLTRAYQAGASLFVPDAMWSPEDSSVYIELK